jgi:homocysteine S-methyltransferase
LSQLDLLEEAGVAFVNVPDGPRATTRAGSLHVAAFANRDPKRRLKVFPHLTTRDRNLIALQADLLGASINGVRDLLVVTGDSPSPGAKEIATAVHDVDSIGLTRMIAGLNRGVGTDFGIGVAVNPSAIDLGHELERWHSKCDAGADFAMTQMIFDADDYLRWRDKLGEREWRPHLVGVWPLLGLRNAEFLASKVPGVRVPDQVLSEMAKAEDDPAEAIKRGLDLAHQMMRRLWDACEGFCVIAPLNRVDVAAALVKRSQP